MACRISTQHDLSDVIWPERLMASSDFWIALRIWMASWSKDWISFWPLVTHW